MMLLFATDTITTNVLSVTNWVIIGIAVVVVLFVLFRWVRNVSRRNDADFIQSIINDVSTWLDRQDLMDKEKAKAELESVFNGEPADQFREHLLRLECRFLQTSPSICQLTTTMVFKKDDDIHETSFTKNVDWDMLPSDIRKDFITNNQKEITFDFLKKKECK